MHQPFCEFAVAHFVFLIPSGASCQEVGIIGLPIRIVLLRTLHECLLIVLHFRTRHPAQRAAHPREIDGTCVVPGLMRRLAVAQFRQMAVERRTIGHPPRLAQQLCQLSARIVLIRIGEQFGTGRKIVLSGSIGLIEQRIHPAYSAIEVISAQQSRTKRIGTRSHMLSAATSDGHAQSKQANSEQRKEIACTCHETIDE